MKTKTILLILFYFLFYNECYSQSIIHSRDTTICQGQQILLHATFDTTFTTVGMDTIDDVYSVAMNIGFPFKFYENVYTKCTLSSNSYISFDTSYFSQPLSIPNFSQFTITNAIPSTSNPLNSIFGVWHDIDPSVYPHGIRTYLRTGVAPNRKFVYSFCNVPMFACNNLTYSGQIILYEGSNNIEIHVGNKVLCPSWNTGSAIIGVQDSLGTKASFPIGYNYPTNWSATNQSWRFVWDNSIKNYTNSSIPFNPVPVNTGGSWYLNGNLVSGDSSFLVSPTATSVYYINALGCSPTNDSVVVKVIQLNATSTIQNSNCATGIGGTIVANVNATNWPVNIAWKDNTNNLNVGNSNLSATTNTNGISMLTPGIYSFTLTDSIGCKSYDTFNIISLNFPQVSFSQKNTSCASDTTGFIIGAIQNNTINYTFTWYDKNHNQLQNHSQNSNDTLSNIKAGKYFVKITTSPYCVKYDSITITSPSFNLNFNFKPLVCANSTNTYTASSNQTNATYYWSWGDNSSIDSINPINHTYLTAGTYTIKLIIKTPNGCSDTLKKSITVLKKITADFTFNQDVLCLQQKLTVTDKSNPYPINWKWDFGNGNLISNTKTAFTTYNISGQFKVTLIAIDSLCGIDTISKTVAVIPPPSINLGDDIVTCFDAEVAITTDVQASSYLWSNSSTLKNIKVKVAHDYDTIWVEIKNSMSCINRDTIIIKTQPCVVIFPSAFTPNNDGINDIFGILGTQIKKYNLSIYDRWGILIYNYDGTDTKLGWDGKYLGVEQPDGIYFYYGKAIFNNDDSNSYKGNVHLLR
ncbi:MAG: hypothetical protein RIQ33_2532 [Bacteroidota bacterium]|jgi:gliding motility-associated-like protein